MLSLRWYQEKAVDAAWDYIRTKPGNPCIELPTGAGKSIVIAKLIEDALAWGARVLLVAHRKELLEQTADKIHALAPEADVGVYSAGLKRRDRRNACILAGIQSVYNKAEKLGRFDLILIDEAHLIPIDGEGMFRQLIGDAQVVNPNVRVIGLTATPYRLKEGLVCGPDNVLNEICVKVGVKQLIQEGFLCKLISKHTTAEVDVEGVGTRGGEFIASELAKHAAEDEVKIVAACREIIETAADRHSILIFCTGREHAAKVAEALRNLTGDQVGYVDGETASGERAETLEAFRAMRLRWLVNIDVLTTGFDATCVDCVALMRPTLSPGLYYQMVGRGLRLDPSKSNCLVLDFGRNVERHGPIDRIEVKPKERASSSGEREPITKICPKCAEVTFASCRVCPDCGFVFPEPVEVKHETQASSAPVVSEPKVTRYKVDLVSYYVHTKRDNPDGPRSMRVEYRVGYAKSFSEWICVEHSGFARDKAAKWWAERSLDECPANAEVAVRYGDAGYLSEPAAIVVDEGGKFPEILSYEDLTPPTEAETIGDLGNSFLDQAVEILDLEYDLDDLPF